MSPRPVIAAATLLLTAGCATFHSGPMPREPAAAHYVQLGDTRVRFTDSGGDGSPVVLIHGFASSLVVWDGVVPALRGTHRVITLDLRGFGWTDRPAADYSPGAEAQLVLTLLDHLGVARADFVAHSWGASVALAAALRAPERVARLALYSAWVYEEQLPTFFVWARAPGLGEFMFDAWYKERVEDRVVMGYYDPHRVTQQLVDDIAAALERPGTVAAALAAARGQRFAEVEDRYRNVRQPVLLLWGRDDRVAHLDAGERLSTELPNARLSVYPRCGHFPMLEAAAASTRDLAAFLAPPMPAAAVPATAPVPATGPAPAPASAAASAPEAASPPAPEPASTPRDDAP